MTAYTRHGPKADECAERLIAREVLACQSSLIDLLLKRPDDMEDVLCWGDVEGLYPAPEDWSLSKCARWLDDMGWNVQQTLLDYGPDITDDGDEAAEEVHEALADEIRDKGEAAEVFEWWLVTKWLADRLREGDQVILDAQGHGLWWGRCTTGQNMILDGVFQEIAHGLGWDAEEGGEG